MAYFLTNMQPNIQCNSQCLQNVCKHLLQRQTISFYFAVFGDELFLFVEIDLPRCCCGCGDFEVAARLRLLAAGTADFLGLETAADDFTGDFTAGEVFLAAGERILPRVTRFSAVGGVFDTDRLEPRGILTISAANEKCIDKTMPLSSFVMVSYNTDHSKFTPEANSRKK